MAADCRDSDSTVSANRNGYTHGAYQSGKEAAAAYLHEVGKGPNPKDVDALSLCDW